MSVDIDNERFRKLLLSFPGKAIAFLYRFYYHSLVKISVSLTHDQNASEDIVQETFIQVWEQYKWLGQYHERSIQHYLVKVVKNKSITSYKKNVRFHEKLIKRLNGNPLKAAVESIEINIIESEIGKELRLLVSTFPRREKECLLMKVDEELNADQIAARLQISRKAVERSLTSAHKRLRRYWAMQK